LNSTITATNATTASRTPMRRTKRLERFKAITPEWCDRWHHCRSGPGGRRLYQWATRG
jgi:hypothetical protein